MLPRATVLLKQLRTSYALREGFILRFSVVCTCLIAFACVFESCRRAYGTWLVTTSVINRVHVFGRHHVQNLLCISLKELRLTRSIYIYIPVLFVLRQCFVLLFVQATGLIVLLWLLP